MKLQSKTFKSVVFFHFKILNLGLSLDQIKKYSTSNKSLASSWVFHDPYESTFRNLAISKDTKVICQGFTGKQVKQTFPYMTIYY